LKTPPGNQVTGITRIPTHCLLPTTSPALATNYYLLATNYKVYIGAYTGAIIRREERKIVSGDASPAISLL